MFNIFDPQMQDNTDDMIKNLIQSTNEYIDSIINANDNDVINTYKNTVQKKWKAAYTILSQEVLDSEYNVKLPPSNVTRNAANILIVQHLLRHDDYEIASLVPDSKDVIDDYISLKNIEKGIKENNLEPLRHLLYVKGFKSDRLTFLYHALSYLLTLKYKTTQEAIMYAKDNFEIQHRKELTKILPLCFFEKRLSCTIIEYRKKLMRQLYNDFSLVKSLPQFDALELLVKAGTDAIPKLVRASDVFEQYNINYQFGGELPVDLEVPVKYHSLFVCPVMKMFCGNDNPPIRLNCGHVISRGAVERISKDNRFVVFKCPYCPHDSKTNDVRELKL